MENKKVAILVLAIAAAVLIATSGAYAMGRQSSGNGLTSQGSTYAYGMGPSMMGANGGHYGGMMGGASGYTGGMMGSYGMMGTGSHSYMMQQMWQYMRQFWNSTSTP